MNKQQGAACIRRRLDHALASFDWLQMFPKTLVQHLNMEASDHSPILIKTQGEKETFHRPFCFLQAWTMDYNSFKVVKEAWQRGEMHGLESQKLICKLKSISQALKEWNKNFFGFTHSKIKELEEN